jgi:hypothetical protein
MHRSAPFCLVLMLAGAAAAGGDSLFTVSGHTDAFQMAGRSIEARDVQTRVWLDRDKMRRDEADTSTILRFDRNKMYLVNHEEKTYSEIDLPVDWKKLVPKGNEQMIEQVDKMSRMEVTVKPTTEARKIRQWNARKVQVDLANPTGLKISTALWVCKEVAGYGAYNRMLASVAALQPGAADWAREIARIDGFPVAQEATVSLQGAVFKTREELVSVEDKPAPPGTYDIPAGYAIKPYSAGETAQ